MVKIVLRGPNGEEHCVELGSEDVVIGRESGCQIQIEDPLISRRHARIGWRIVTEDLGSTNGMWKEGRRLQSAVMEPGQPITLGRGEKFVLGLDSTVGAPPAGTGDGPSPESVRERDQRIHALEGEVKELRLRPPYDSWKEVCRRLEDSQKTIAEQEERIEQLKRGTVLPSDEGTIEVEELQRALEKAKQSLRDRDRKIEVLERDLDALRQGAIGSETHEDLRHELEEARARLRDRETQIFSTRETCLDLPAAEEAAGQDANVEELQAARARIRELESKTATASLDVLAEKEGRIADLQRTIEQLRAAQESEAPPVTTPHPLEQTLAEKERRIADLQSELERARASAPKAVTPIGDDTASAVAAALGTHMLGGHELRPRATLLDETMLLLSRLHRIASATDEGIARALENFRGVLMPLASMVPDAGKGYLTTVREFLLLGSDHARKELETYLDDLQSRAGILMNAYGRGADRWLAALLERIGPGAMRKEARLPEEGKLATRHAGKLWLRYEGVMQSLLERGPTFELNEYVAKAIIELTHRS